MLIGRGMEVDRVEALVSCARRGVVDVVVLRGEAGAGKTALLRHAAAAAGECTVLAVTAIESEGQLPFGLTSALARPLMRHADSLPVVQARCLRTALGEEELASTEVHMLGVALLGLLTQAARDAPLLMIIDDLHWADEVSVRALVFALRRMERDAIGTLLAHRNVAMPALDGARFATVDLPPLGPADVAALVEDVRGYRPSLAVARELTGATWGNPLAIIELARTLDRAVLAGTAPLPFLLPLGDRLLDAYVRRIRQLDLPTQRALLIAASSDESLATVLDGLSAFGAGSADLIAAERAGLINTNGDRLVFAHPLIRTAVVRVANAVDRRDVHRVMSQSQHISVEARAWHLAMAANGPDAIASAALVSAAASAQRRGDHPTAADMWVRAAELEPEPTQRATITMHAAESALLAGDLDRCHRLARIAHRAVPDPRSIGRTLRLLGMTSRDPRAGHSLCLQAAAILAPIDSHAALEAVNESAARALDLRSIDLIRQSIEIGHHIDRTQDPRTKLIADCLFGTAQALIGDIVKAVPALVNILDLIDQDENLRDDPQICAEAIVAAGFLGRVDFAHALANHAIILARRVASIPLIAAITGQSGEIAIFRSDWQRARALLGEAAGLYQAMGDEDGHTNTLGWLSRLDANCGDDSSAREAANRRLQWSEANGITRDRPPVIRTLATLDMRNGLPEVALRRLAAEASVPFVGRGVRNGPLTVVEDLVDAAVSAGKATSANEAVQRLVRYAKDSPDPLASALAARCQAQLADGDDAGQYFEKALELHNHDPDMFAMARTQLTYAKWMRRRGRRTAAREHLYTALEIFDRLGALPWYEQTRHELRATGETVGPRTGAKERLTAQELRIALAVSEGITNREVAERLYISVKTVEYHLSAVFRKLGVTSRAQLARHPLAAKSE